MPEMIWVKPVEGCTVMEPVTKMNMPPGGMFIAVGDPHWMAHLRFGDIEEVDAPPPEHMAELAAMAEAKKQADAEAKRKADEKLAADLQAMQTGKAPAKTIRAEADQPAAAVQAPPALEPASPPAEPPAPIADPALQQG